MQDVAGIYLDVLDVKFGLAVDEDLASIVFLATLLGVEVGSVDYYTDLCVGGDLLRTADEGLVVVDGLDFASDISSSCERSAFFFFFYIYGGLLVFTILIPVICLGDILHQFQFTKIVNI